MKSKKSLGGSVNSIWQSIADYIRETNKTLLILCIIASVFGCALIYSAMHYTGSNRTVITQMGAVLLGVISAVGVSLIDYKSLTKHPSIFIIGSIFLLALTYFIGYAPEGTENKAWIELPFGMSLQVSEIIKISMILTFSHHVQSLNADEINRPKNLILLSFHALIFPALVMILQRDLGTVIIMLCIAICMMFAAGVKIRYFILAFSALGLMSPFIWFFGLSEYQKERFSIIANLEADPMGLGYQQLQGLNAIGSGGLFGEGYLNGTYIQSASVPKAYNDFIFAVAGNELGFVGCILVVLILTVIILRIMQISNTSHDIQGKIICFGVFGMFASQILVNLGMVLSILPVIGVTLPFFSAGGSSLVMLFVSIGLTLSVYINRFKRSVSLND